MTDETRERQHYLASLDDESLMNLHLAVRAELRKRDTRAMVEEESNAPLLDHEFKPYQSQPDICMHAVCCDDPRDRGRHKGITYCNQPIEAHTVKP